MGEPNQLFEMLRAIGVMVETSKLIYDNSLRVGFSAEQAFEMAKTPIQMAFLPQRNGEQED